MINTDKYMINKSHLVTFLCLFLMPFALHAQKEDFSTLIETGSKVALSESLKDAQKILKKEKFKLESADEYSLAMDSPLSYVMVYDTPNSEVVIDTVAFMLKQQPRPVELNRDAVRLGFESVDVTDPNMKMYARESAEREQVLVMFSMQDEETKFVVLFTTRKCYESKYGVIKKNGKPYFKHSQTVPSIPVQRFRFNKGNQKWTVRPPKNVKGVRPVPRPQ